MRAISSIVALVFVPVCAWAQPPQGTPVSPNTAPVEVTHPPVPPDLAPVNPDFQAAMANSQLQTYRYSQLTEQALALKKLCDTGFGPADICPRGGAAVGANAASGADAGLPTVAAIDGGSGALTAVLVLADGRRLSVRQGSILPDGLVVAAITSEDVRVRTLPGREERLAFESGGAR